MKDADKKPVKSGEKFVSAEGITAIKDGVKASASQAKRQLAAATGAQTDATNVVGQHPPTSEPSSKVTTRKPKWLRAKIPGGARFEAVKRNVRSHRLSTVCEESYCPNIGECWSNGTATIMVMGSVCTRACQFCAVDTGNPKGWLDAEEPANVAESVELMGLRYIVLTSVDRDDLPDGGAAHYADCVQSIKSRTPAVKVEALTPDFCGDESAVSKVVHSGLDVFAQNVETVKRLTHPVRDPRAGYQQTLDVLAFAKKSAPDVLTKTSIMVGLGETDAEIYETMDDLRAIGVDILTLGQYLQPTKNHLPVDRFVTPEQFNHYREVGLEKGFLEVASGPMVRSSYRADQVFERNNLGLSLPDVPEASRIPVKSID